MATIHQQTQPLVEVLLRFTTGSLLATTLMCSQNAYAVGQFVQPSEFTNEFPADSKIINVTNWSSDPTKNVAPNDGIDDTARIQYILDRFDNVSDDSNAAQHMIYFPAGTYNVSNTLSTVKNSKYYGRPKIIGHSAADTILRLKDNATGFGTGQNKPVIHIGLTSNLSFASYFTDMQVDVGSGNPGAVGVQFVGHNYAALQRVTIKAAANSGSVGLVLGNLPQETGYIGIGPHLTTDVNITGFDLAVSISGAGGAVLERFHFSGQRSAAVTTDSGGTPVGLRDVVSVQSGAVPVYVSSNRYSCGPSSFNGCHFINTSGGGATPAISLTSTDSPIRRSAFHIKGVVQSGYGSMLVENGTVLVTAASISELQQTLRSESGATGPRVTSAPQNLRSPDIEVPDAPLYMNHNFSADYISAGPGDSTGADDVAFRAALSSGKKVIYMPTHGPASDLSDANSLRLQGDYTIPGSVEAIDFFYQSIYLVQSVQFIVGGSASDPPLVIRRFENTQNGWPGATNTRGFSFVHQSGRMIVLEDLVGNYDALPGAGSAYLNNCVFSRVTGASGQKIFARQLDQEQAYAPYGNGINVPFISLNGTTMWLSNWKTEIPRPVALLTNGATLEASVLGMANPFGDSSRGKWFLDTVDSVGSVVAVVSDSGYNAAYPDLIREKRGSTTTTHVVPDPGNPIDGFKHGQFLANPADQAGPSTPVMTMGSVGGNSVILNWTDVSGEDAYSLEYATNPAFSRDLVKLALSANATTRTVTGLLPLTSYYFRLRAKSGALYSARSAPVAATTTIAPPTAPSGLGASAFSQTQINLTWTDNSSNETGFKIERKTGTGGSWAQIATPAANAASYSDSGLTAATIYVYRVRATSAAGDSSYSSEASATTTSSSSGNTLTFVAGADAHVNSQYPTTNYGTNVAVAVQKSASRNLESYFRFAVSGVAGTVTSAKLRLKESPTGTSSSNNVPMSVRQITETWTESGVIWNTKPAYAGVSLGTVPANTIANDAVVDIVLSPALFTGNGTYDLALIGTADGGDTPFMSREAGTNGPQLILTVLSTPAAPTNLNAVTASSSAISLTWNDSSTNETGFEIERKTGASGTWALISTVASNVVFYQNTGLSQATAYYYRVRAVGTAGGSGYSGESAAATAGSLGFIASADTRVSSTSVSTNYGSDLTLAVQKSSSRDMETYLRFNLSGVTGTVTSAKLRLKESPTGTSSLNNGAMSVRAISASWTETTATWSNRPAYSATSLGIVPALSISNDALVEIDLDASHFTGNGVYDLAVIGTSNGNDSPFVSRENATNQPQLVLTIGTGGAQIPGAALVVPFQWRHGFGLPSDGSEDLAQPGADGICNVLKIALNLADSAQELQMSATHRQSDPDGTTAEGVSGMPAFYIDADGHGVLCFIRRSDAASIGLRYEVEWGGSPDQMAENPEAVEALFPLDGPWERVKCKDTRSRGEGNQRFSRLRVTAE